MSHAPKQTDCNEVSTHDAHRRTASPSCVSQLALRWREEAAILGGYGAAEQTAVLLKCAAELEASEREHALEELSLEAAVTESGFSYSSLQKKLANGELENVGGRGRPRVRRGALPRKGEVAGGIADQIHLRRQG